MAERNNPFQSFWMAGFECTDQLNAFGNRVDFLTETSHLALIDFDYQNLHPFQLNTVREGLRWSQVEFAPYQYDWNLVGIMIKKGIAHNIQQVWDICHFGFPDDLSPLHPMFARRFAAFCVAFIRFYRSIVPNGTLIVTPINEVSFLSWLGGEVRGTSPYTVRLGWEVKYSLMKAYIEGAKAILKEDPTVRMLTTEPLVNIVAPLFAIPSEETEAICQHEDQYQCLDMLCGKLCPELGGNPDLLDMIGCNFYYNNQWEAGYTTMLPWRNEIPDNRWRPLSHLMEEVYLRYKRPLVLSETSHPGEDRPAWIHFIGHECAALIKSGVPLWGICIYPIIDRPDWDHLQLEWHHSGLWDIGFGSRDSKERILNLEYATALIETQNLIATTLSDYNHLQIQSYQNSNNTD